MRWALPRLLISIALGCAAPPVKAVPEHSPFSLRLANHEIPDSPEEFRALCRRLVDMGHSAVVLDVPPPRVVYLDTFDSGLMPSGSVVRARTDANRARLAWQIEVARDEGLMPVALGDALEFPAEVLARPWSPEITLPGADPGAPRLHTAISPEIFDVESERLWELHRAIYVELLRDFPGIGAVMVRSGESSAHRSGGDHIGHGVYPQFLSRGRLTAMGVDYEARMARLINETADAICPTGTLYIHRTWDTEADLFHADPDAFEGIMGQVEPRENLMLSTKFTAVDFFSHAAPNPTFGIGPWRRMVEFQIAREYEGKGAFPNWLGDIAAEALRRARDLGVEGVWIWHTGGGQGGPVPASNLWNEMNSQVVTRLMMNPDIDPGELMADWIRREIGVGAADTLPQMLRDSHHTLVALRHFGVYGEEPQWAETAADTWMRDNVIRGDRWLARVYADHPDRVDEMIREKRDALQDMTALERALAASGESSEAEFLRASVAEEVAVAEVVVPFVHAYFRYRQWQDTGDDSLRAEIEAQLAAWERAWAAYRDRPSETFPSTPHRDDGMVETVERMRERLTRPRDLALAWEISRLWPNPDHRGFDTPHGPEIDETASWRVLPAGYLRDGYADLNDLFAPENDWVLVYARTTVEARRETQCQLRLGTDDGVKAWVNGELVWALDARRPAVEDEDIVEITLRPGANEIVLKITEGILGWGFYARLTDAEGLPVAGVRPREEPALGQATTALD